MTTASEAFAAPVAGGGRVSGPIAAADAPRAPELMRARGYRSLSVFGKVHRAWSTVRADVAGAWPWRGSAPTLRELWLARIPALDRVPGNNRPLWLGWVVFNHVALVVTAVVAPALWLLHHPARLGLALLLCSPFMFVIFS